MFALVVDIFTSDDWKRRLILVRHVMAIASCDDRNCRILGLWNPNCNVCERSILLCEKIQQNSNTANPPSYIHILELAWPIRPADILTLGIVLVVSFHHIQSHPCRTQSYRYPIQWYRLIVYPACSSDIHNKILYGHSTKCTTNNFCIRLR